MRVLYLVLIFQVHAQLKCDKSTIRTTIGREINILCTFNSNSFLYSKKYWCFGESRSACEVLMTTDGFTTARFKQKARIYERFKTFHIFMTGVQLEDTGIYWAAINKIYADIMFRIEIVVTEEAVSRPQIWLDGLPIGTCQGQPVLLHCRTGKGTNVKYSWLREAQPHDVLLESSAELHLRCSLIAEDAQYVCSAQNAVSREQSKPISLHVQQVGQENCIYSLTSDELESYDCRTTTVAPMTSTSTSMEGSTSEFVTLATSGGNQSLCSNQIQNWNETFCIRSWSEVPMWYAIFRWVLFIAMITALGLVRLCTHNSGRSRKQRNQIR